MATTQFLTPEIPDSVRRLIDNGLDEIERENDVRILFAVESGSRAWGFPSPDSDFDVRFVYVHKPEWYLSIDQRRDVIEIPIDGDLDIGGWDLKKALQLLVKPNPVLLEWLRSPIVYRADTDAMGKIAALGEKAGHLRPSTHHYLSLATSQHSRFIAGRDAVPLKKYFYALRPALALAWMRANPASPVPMSLAELLAGVRLPSEVGAFVEDLLARKVRTRELGAGPRIPALDDWIEGEIRVAEASIGDLKPADQSILAPANDLFRQLVAGA